MKHISNIIQNTISISLFNRGLAGKIFDEVKRIGAKVVMKNNTAECVLMSPKEYIQLIDEINDTRLITLATERMQQFDPSNTISQEEVDRQFGFTPEDLIDADEVESE